MTIAPIRLGVLIDQTLHHMERSHLDGLSASLATGRGARAVELDLEHADVLPAGTEADLERAFRCLITRGALAIVGPAVSDNAVPARDLAAAAGVACLNWSGHEATRSEYCFQFQLGSLEEEPLVLVEELVRRGAGRIALVHDRSVTGDHYVRWFDSRLADTGIAVGQRLAVDPLTVDGAEMVRRVRRPEIDTLVYLGLGHSAHALGIAMREDGWDVPVLANSALMYGHMHPERRAAWDGWVYVDMFSDRNPLRARLRSDDPRSWQEDPIGLCAYDMGQILAEAFTQAPQLSRSGVLAGMQRVSNSPPPAGIPARR